MTGSLPTLKPRELLRALNRAGFYIHHQTGSHARLLHRRQPGLRVTVPIHNRDLGPNLSKSILKQAQLTADELIAFLN